MIYLVSKQEQLFESALYSRMGVEESIERIKSWDVVQYDSETSGRDPHICKLLCVQFGNDADDCRIVVDTTTIDIRLYKEILETKLLITVNGKFDYQFLFNYGIVPTHNWDCMVVEQALHLGFDKKYFHCSLKAIAERRLGIDIDKTTRGEIIWRGLDEKVVIYAAGDVEHLEQIYYQQLQEVLDAHCQNGVEIENRFVTWNAYLEWCGIRLDVNKWIRKMHESERIMNEALARLNKWLVDKSNENWVFKKFTDYDPEDLFHDQFDEQCIVNWQSAPQVIEICKLLGFNVKTEDKKTGESKESAVAKLLKKQKGIDDKFLSCYFDYTEKAKDYGTYGQTYIDAINPITGRIHSQFRQLGCDSGRMSCGGGNKDFNKDLAKYKGLSENKCKYVQLQNLPSDDVVDGITGFTRHCFIPNEGNLMCSSDYSALESRLGADIYKEKAMIDEYLHGSGDIHSLTAKACFPNELKDVPVEMVKKVRPDLRSRAKPVEFSQQFGGSAKAIRDSLGCSYQEAKEIAEAYKNGFKGIADFKEKGSKFVRSHGYILISKYTGLRLYWEDWKKWKEIEDMPDGLREREYSSEELKEHNMAASKYDRLALNVVTQGTGASIIKLATILFGNWILKKGLFGKVLLCDIVHDEIVCEFPKELADTVPEVLKTCMETASSQMCKALPIPAVPETGDHWIH